MPPSGVPVIAIRREAPADADAVREVHTLAFGQPDEAALVDRLRDRAAWYLGLVAVDGGALVGHIVFTPVPLDTGAGVCTLLALAPVAVRPARQRHGIGSALVREGLAACRAAGHDVVVVVGHPAFYPRFGFVRARPLGLTSEPAFADEAFMVAELPAGALRGRQGVVRYGAEFGAGH
jgi:putative acetyltransferase